MSRYEERVKALLKLPLEMDIGDVDAILSAHGWTWAGGKGDHRRYAKPGEPPIIIVADQGRWVRRVYLKQLAERLGLRE